MIKFGGYRDTFFTGLSFYSLLTCDLSRTRRVHLLARTLLLLRFSALTGQYRGLVCHLPVGSYRHYYGWTIIIESYADHFYFFTWSSYLWLSDSDDFLPCRTHEFITLMLLMLYLLLVVLRRYWTMLWTRVLPTCGFLLGYTKRVC